MPCKEKPVRLVGGATRRPISDGGAEQAIRRMCKPDSKGKRKVNADIAKQFLEGGQGRKEFIKFFIDCGGNHEPCQWLVYVFNQITFNILFCLYTHLKKQCVRPDCWA